eukprot:s2415_g11.t1
MDCRSATAGQGEMDLGPFASIIGKWNDVNQYGKSYEVKLERNRLQVVMMGMHGRLRDRPKTVDLTYRPNPPELLWERRYSLKQSDFSLVEIRWRFLNGGQANHWKRAAPVPSVPTPPPVPPPLPRPPVRTPPLRPPSSAPVKRSRSRSPRRGDGLASPVPPPVDDAYDTYPDHDEELADPAYEADDDDAEAEAEAEGHDDGDEVEDAEHDHGMEQGDPNHKDTLQIDRKEVQIDVLTCGLRDRERCEEEAHFVVDMRSFYDPGCGPLKRHDGRHNEIIRRMVHHHLFTDLVRDLRQQLEEHLEDQSNRSVKFLLFCKSGRHRSVAAGGLLHYILLSEGYSSTELHHVSLGDGCGCDICSKPSAQRCLACEEGLRKWRSED